MRALACRERELRPWLSLRLPDDVMRTFPWNSIRRAMLIGAITGWTSGCAAPLTVYRPVSAVVADEAGRELELRLTSGERYIIGNAHVRNDTLFALGLVPASPPDSELAVPVVRIASLRRTERGLTAAGAGAAGLTVGLLGGLLVFLALLTANWG